MLDTSVFSFSKFFLTLYHTIPTFNNPNKEAFENIEEKEKMLVTH